MHKALAAAGCFAAALSVPGLALAEKKDKDEEKKERQARGPLFDPEALERGAKALREINKSPYAKQVSGLPTLMGTRRGDSEGISYASIHVGRFGALFLSGLAVWLPRAGDWGGGRLSLPPAC